MALIRVPLSGGAAKVPTRLYSPEKSFETSWDQAQANAQHRRLAQEFSCTNRRIDAELSGSNECTIQPPAGIAAQPVG